MDRPRWRFPAADPAGLTGCRVQELTFRFPSDATPSGGEMLLVSLTDTGEATRPITVVDRDPTGKELGRRAATERADQVIALEPGEADTLMAALLPWLQGALARRARLPQGSRIDVTPAAPPRPAAPERPLGTL